MSSHMATTYIFENSMESPQSRHEFSSPIAAAPDSPGSSTTLVSAHGSNLSTATLVDRSEYVETRLRSINGENNYREHVSNFLITLSYFDKNYISYRYFCKYGDHSGTYQTNLIQKMLKELEDLCLLYNCSDSSNNRRFILNPDVHEWRNITLEQHQEALLLVSDILTSYIQTTDETQMACEAKLETMRHIDAYLISEEQAPGPVSRLRRKFQPDSSRLFGVIYHSLCRYSNAMTLYTQAVKDLGGLRGPKSIRAIEIMNLLGLLYTDQGNYEAAEELLRDGLEALGKHDGDHEVALHLMKNLANCYQRHGKYRAAESIFQDLLQIEKQKLGPDHIEVQFTLGNLAVVHASQGHFKKAEKIFESVLEQEENQLGRGHSEVLVTTQNLASVYFDQNQYNKALKLYKTVLERRKEILGLDHPYTLDTLASLGMIFLHHENFAQASSSLERAFSGTKKLLGPKHPRTLRVMEDLAILYLSQIKYTESEEYLLYVLKENENIQGSNHPDTLQALHNLGILYQKWSSDMQADQPPASTEELCRKFDFFFESALTGRKRILGPEHPCTLVTAQQLERKEHGPPPRGLGIFSRKLFSSSE